MIASLCRLLVTNDIGVRVGFDMDASHVVSQGVLSTITLIGGVAGVRGAGVCSGSQEGLPLWSVAFATLSGVGSAPKLLEWKS